MLIHLEWHDHFEDGDIHLEGLLIVEVLHGIGTIHLSHLGAQVAAADILVPFAWLQDGLYADDAFAFDLSIGAVAVEDMPVTPL